MSTQMMKKALLVSMALLSTAAVASVDYVNDYETFTEYDAPEPTEVPTPQTVPAAEQKPAVQAPRTLEQVRSELFGESVLSPSPESLLGKYLKETGAQVVTRSFLTAPVGNVNPPSKQGPQRLVVGVSLKTFDRFKKHFSNKNMLYLYYEPNGSMLAVYRGKYGNLELQDDVTYAVPGSVLVPIVLSDTEASRVTKFFNMARDPSLQGYANAPWYLKSKDGKPYSAATGFSGCTHWFTSIPMGDTRVSSYIFPSEAEDNLAGKKPFKQTLVNYVTPADLSKDQEKLLRSVWKVPGHQQLGEVLNPLASRRGEFTNVGWIAYSLLGSQGVDRVPLVFLLVDDVKKKISPKFPLQIREE